MGEEPQPTHKVCPGGHPKDEAQDGMKAEKEDGNV